MPYGQKIARIVQETKIHVNDTAWVPLQSSVNFPSTGGETTPLANRFAIKVYNVSEGATSRLGLSYDNTVGLKDAKQWLGVAEVMVDPVGPGLILYGRGKPAAGTNSMRIMVTEYGN